MHIRQQAVDEKSDQVTVSDESYSVSTAAGGPL
jgi:hypothetical protein